MDKKRAQNILKDCIQRDGSLRSNDEIGWINWGVGDVVVCLDGDFTPDMLEAIAWWMRQERRPVNCLGTAVEVDPSSLALSEEYDDEDA